MRKYIIFFMICFSTLSLLSAQEIGEYWIKVQTPYVDNTGNGSDGCDIKSYALKKDGTQLVFQEKHWNSMNAHAHMLVDTDSKAHRFPATEKPSEIYFYGYRDHAGSGAYQKTVTINISNFYPYHHKTYEKADGDVQLYDGFNSEAEITIMAYDINYYYYNPDGILSATNFLPSLDKITIKATKGFEQDAYTVRYEITEPFVKRGLLPVSCYNADRSEFTFNALDILTEDELMQLIRHKKAIRVSPANDNYFVYCCYKTLYPIISAPEIVDVKTKAPTCYDGADGEINMTFNRALMQDEKLYVFFDNEARERTEIIIDPETKTGTIYNKPGNYNFSLHGVYYISSTDTVNTYTEGRNHKKNNVSIPQQNPVDITSLTTNAIHCKNGEDGKINLTASGSTVILPVPVVPPYLL